MNGLYTHFDEQTLLARYGPEATPAVIEIYREELPSQIASLKDAVHSGLSRKIVTARAHSLKGSLGMISANELSSLAAQIEASSNELSEKELQSLCGSLIGGLRALEAELAQLSADLNCSA